MFLVRDADGFLFKKLKNPTVVYDKDLFILLCIGEPEAMESAFYRLKQHYNQKGQYRTANDICLLELPKNQDILDKVWQTEGAYLSQITLNDYK